MPVGSSRRGRLTERKRIRGMSALRYDLSRLAARHARYSAGGGHERKHKKRRLASPAKYEFSTKSLTLNSASSLISSITTAAALFLIFRLEVGQVSASAMGCWALLQGFFVGARISDSGAGTNVTRQVAAQIRAGDPVDVARTVIASLLIGTAPVFLLSIAVYFPATGYVTHRFHSEIAAGGIQHLALLSLAFAVTSSAATIILAALEGMFWLVTRNLLTAAGNLIALVIAFPIIHLTGVPGIGYTYVFMSASQCVLGIVFLVIACRKTATCRSRLMSIIRAMWTQNLQLSFIAVLRLTFEPMTKLLLSTTTGLAGIASFDLALRISTQLRVFLQALVQPLLILGARSDSEMDVESKQKFEAMRRHLAWTNSYLLEIQLVAAPLLSWVGFGSLNKSFVIFLAILAFANQINTLGLVGYYYQISSGSMRPLARLQSVMALINLVVGGGACLTGSSIAVVAVYGIAMAYGGLASAALMEGTVRGIASMLGSFFRELPLIRVAVWLTVPLLLPSQFNSASRLALYVAVSAVLTGIVTVALLRGTVKALASQRRTAATA